MSNHRTVPESYCAVPDEVIEEIIAGVNPVCVTRAVLFGSAVEPEIDANDIDVLVLSEDFAGVQFDMRQSLLKFPEKPFIDSWLYTLTEFDKIYPESSQFRQKIEYKSVNLLP